MIRRASTFIFVTNYLLNDYLLDPFIKDFVFQETMTLGLGSVIIDMYLNVLNHMAAKTVFFF